MTSSRGVCAYLTIDPTIVANGDEHVEGCAAT